MPPHVTAQPSFIHLRVHTEYSLVDGVVRVKPLMQALAEDNMPAVALTDQSNLFAMVKFTRAALGSGIKPIIGVDALVSHGENQEAPFQMVLLAQNKQGYLNLSELISRSYLVGQHRGQPIMQAEWIVQHAEGIIALSGGRNGDIGRALLNGQLELAKQRLNDWSACFQDRFYIELQRTGRENEELYIAEAVDLAIEYDIPVVATNDVRFLKADEFEAHEARVCIHDGRTLDDPRRPKNYSEQQYLRSAEEMQALFADIPEALANTVEIAKRCNLEIKLGESFLPQFPIPEGETETSYFCRVSQEGLEQRLKVLLDENAEDYAEQRKKYEQRLQVELDVINNMGFPGYFLIVADFIQWSKDNGIPVGPGRGSGAGSLVAYALKITDLDPLQFDLLFERFLNPERVSLPDFDVDFCMEGRDRVIDYVAQKYGRDSVSQIITYGTMAAKAVVRDVGRVMGQPYGFVDRLAKMVPFELGMTLSKALEESEDLKTAYDTDEEVALILDMALSLEGLARNAGKHAGGVVISPTVLTDFSPLYCEEGGQSIVTQFDKDDVEAVGLVKFDFLGLRTLTIIDWAVKHVNRRRKAGEDLLKIEHLPLDDKATFDLLQAANTTAVFQLESRGMKDLITRLQPDSFEDIVALVALFRPGPLQSGMVDDFINRKHGRAEVDYFHPDLEQVLTPTYGVILYQEQVMQIAQVLANYTLGGADMLRRAMGKKKPEVMAQQRELFMNGAVARGVDVKLATHIFDLMEKFAGYGFNKSHSAAYALLSYQTAWLKAHYPAEFMAAVLSADMDNTDKVVSLIKDCHDQGLEVLSPDINRSIYQFSVPDEKSVLYGLGALKGVGEAALEGIITERDANGEFADLYDFCRRSDTRKVNRRVMEALIKSGAMDSLGPNRASLIASLSNAVQLAEQNQKNASVGQHDMFGSSDEPDVHANVHIVEVEDWDDAIRLSNEKETLGLYLTGHPITRYEEELKRFTECRFYKVPDLVPEAERGGGYGRYGKKDKRQYCLAGLLIGMRVRKTKTGSKIVTGELDDSTARIEMVLYEDVYEQYSHTLVKDKVCVVVGSVSYDDFNATYSVNANAIYTMSQAREKFSRGVQIKLDRSKANGSWSDALMTQQLTEVLHTYRDGHCPVNIEYNTGSDISQFVLGEEWNVLPSDELLSRLDKVFGAEHIEIMY